MLADGIKNKQFMAIEDAKSKAAISLAVAGGALTAGPMLSVAALVYGVVGASLTSIAGIAAISLAWGPGIAFEGALIPVGLFLLDATPFILVGSLYLAPAIATIAAVVLLGGLATATYFGIKAAYIQYNLQQPKLVEA